MRAMSSFLRRLLAAGLVLSLAACGGSGGGDNGVIAGGNGGGGGNTGGGGGGTQTGRTFLIKPGDSATNDMIAAMVQAAPGDVIRFDCGYFELTSTLQLINTEDVLIKGCGRDKTVLSFKNNNAPEGILGVNVHGLWIEDLTVLDTAGNGIELRGVDHAAIKRVRAMWSSNGGRESPDPITASNFAQRLNVACTDPPTLNPDAPENQFPGADTSSPDYTVSDKSGRYGIYPVSSENILIENSESIGASDAGIYVGQTNTAIIKNSRAAYNVFGFEIENVRNGKYDGNTAECNTGGFLVYDLDGLRQYGYRSIMRNNVSRNNNTYNFTSGGFVGNVPPGSGMITLSYDRIDVYDNRFENNNTAGIIHASYELFPEGAGRPEEKRIDWYTEGLHIFDNTFINNGNGLPLPTTDDIQSQDLAKFLPALVGLKNQAACLNPANLAACGTATAGLITAACAGNDPLNCFKASLGFRGAHIVWDGLLDSYHEDCTYPQFTENGQTRNVPEDPDLQGKPAYTNEHGDQPCHYNKYKFDTTKPGNPRKVPDWFASCIDTSNEFSGDSLTFANFHGTKGLELVIENNLDPAALASFPSSFDLSPHRCESAYGRNMASLGDFDIPKFERHGDAQPALSEAEVERICSQTVADGAVNFGAAQVNCPRLDQYRLFEDPEDPTSEPRGGGMPFVLNTKLFSDYSVKYRVAYLPPGTQAVYRDGKDGDSATIVFPKGTILAKTFAFPSDDDLDVVETRLLIKRTSPSGKVRWDGLPYIWTTENGKRVARLSLIGGSKSVAWDYTDVDTPTQHEGSTPAYSIPNANQCISCHSGEDKEPGSSPIGPKVRFLNRPYESELLGDSSGQAGHAVAGSNQVDYWCREGLLRDCPDRDLNATQIATNLERVPAFNKPGDAGFAGGTFQDVEARARAYLEVNCAHCHNDRGYAASTGMYLDWLRPIDGRYGICKRPTATGREGNGGRTYDIHPGNVGDSIMPYRLGPEATTPASRMPPIARSVVHTEGFQLIGDWIAMAAQARYPGANPDTGDCSAGSPVPLP